MRRPDGTPAQHGRNRDQAAAVRLPILPSAGLAGVAGGLTAWRFRRIPAFGPNGIGFAPTGPMDMSQATEILTVLRRMEREATQFQAFVITRFEGIDKRFEAIEKRLDGIDRRFDAMERQVDRKIDGLRTELVDHMERIHHELDLRVRDVETAPPRKIRARG
jgi:hypothetical protein